MSGERSAVDEASTDQWIKDAVKATLARYSKKDVFNCDESGLFWRLLPDRTLAFKSDKCSGGKKSKERVTFLLCTNMDGSQKNARLRHWTFSTTQVFQRCEDHTGRV